MHRQTAIAFLQRLNTIEFSGYSNLAKRAPISPEIEPGALSQQAVNVNRPKISLMLFNMRHDWDRKNPTDRYYLPYDGEDDAVAPYIDPPQAWDLHYQVKLVTKLQRDFIAGNEAFLLIMGDGGSFEVTWEIGGHTITETVEYDLVGNPNIIHGYEDNDFHGEITFTYKVGTWLFKPIDAPHEDPILKERRVRVSRDSDMDTWNYYINLETQLWGEG